MYARTVDGQKLTFGVSGMLWKRSLVMYDKETNTHWSHLLGQAMEGQLRGAKLAHIPSSMTDWKTWKARHPETTVLWMSRTADMFRTRMYENPNQFVLAVMHAGQPTMWNFAMLRRTPVRNDQLMGDPVVVLFDVESATARVFDRQLDSDTLTFQQDGKKIVDEQTNSVWDGVTGRCIAGEHRGKTLKPLPGIVSFRKAWLNFHPRTKSIIR